jgi:Ca2+-transporting ATPase
MRSLREVREQLAASAESGLSPESVTDSRARFGANRLTPLPRQPLWRKFLEKFDEPIIKILLAAALLSMIVGLFHASYALGGSAFGLVVVAVTGVYALRGSQWLPTLLFVSAVALFLVGLFTGHGAELVEGLAVMVAVVLATGVAFLSEYKSDREFELLNAHKESQRAKVLRGGILQTLVIEDVVVGDVVLLEAGDEIPADGRLLKATGLFVDQSLMTGEPEPARKQAGPEEDVADGPEQPDCLYRGTQVVDGVGRMVVTEVGDATYLGQIARRLSADEDGDGDSESRVQRKLTVSKEQTPLQLKLENLARLISKIGYAAAIAIFVALLVRGLVKDEVRFTPREFDPDTKKLETTGQALRASAKVIVDYFMYLVIVIVVAVPEGLPMSVTVSLALAMRRMTRENALVRQLVACETIGSATVICSDKTGTLTQNRMQVVRLFWAGQTRDRGTPLWNLPDKGLPWPRDGRPLDWIALNAALNSTANLEEKAGKLVPVGNSTEAALLQWLHEAGIDYAKLRRQFEPLYQIHFSSERKRMTTVVRYGNRLVTLVKGAPEWLLRQSTHDLADDGSARPWTPEARRRVEEGLRDAASQAMRTLAFGYAPLPAEVSDHADALHSNRDVLESGLIFVGFVAIRDPLREDVKEALALCRAAGIAVKMVTGDNAETARAISADAGLLDRRDAAIDVPGAPILTSTRFNELTDEELKDRLPGVRVLARARPLDKFRLVRLLQEQGQVVAVTGDGTNDAPALKKADVGLSMGIAGTEVAKEASKIVLLDDAFSTIVKAVHWGRSLYENIQRFVQFQLTINVSALTIAFLGPFFGIKPPFTVLQLLWLNVIMDTFASIALCSEPPRPGVMRLPPKRRDENILTRPMLLTILGTAAFFVIVMLTLLAGMEWHDWFAQPPTEATSPASTSFPELTVRQVSIFFSVYVFFQVWNQLNCRSLTPEASGFRGLLGNPTFLAIAGMVALGQVLIVSVPFLSAVFKVEPLGLTDWLFILLSTASVLVFAEMARRLRRRVPL